MDDIRMSFCTFMDFFGKVEEIRKNCLQLREQVYNYSVSGMVSKYKPTQSKHDYEILYVELENLLKYAKKEKYRIPSIEKMAISNLKSEILANTSKEFQELVEQEQQEKGL